MPTLRECVISPTEPPNWAADGYVAWYPGLREWQAARKRDLVAADEIERAVVLTGVYGALHGSANTIAGWTTDADRRLEIYVPPEHRHGGRINAGARLVNAPSGEANCMSVGQDIHFWITGLSFMANRANSFNGALLSTSRALSLRMRDCLLGNVSSVVGSNSSLFSCADTRTGTIDIANCTFFGSNNNLLIVAANTGHTVPFISRNNTLVNIGGVATIGLRTTYVASASIHNTVSVGTAENFSSVSSPTTASNNASSDASAPGTSPLHNISAEQFVSTSAYDFRPTLRQGKRSVLINAGIDLTAQGITTDMVGTPRGQSGGWDIGAIERKPEPVPLVRLSRSVPPTRNVPIRPAMSPSESRGPHLWRGLRAAVAPGASQMELTRRAMPEPIGDPAHAVIMPSVRGKALKIIDTFGGAGTVQKGWHYPSVTLIRQPFSVVSFMILETVAGGTGMVAFGGDGSGRGWRTWTNSSGDLMLTFGNIAHYTLAAGYMPGHFDAPLVVGVSVSASPSAQALAYRNGALVNTISVGTVSAGDATSGLALHTFHGGTVFASSTRGSTHFAHYIYDRVLSAEEHAEIAADPWGLITPTALLIAPHIGRPTRPQVTLPGDGLEVSDDAIIEFERSRVMGEGPNG
jgi:hypothetical protein